MKSTDVVVVGAGQAGLAMSRCLTAASVDHVVLERRAVAERWRSERWDSLRLLTPNWLTRLPGWRYDGPDPDGFMTMPEVVRFLEDYAQSFSAPVFVNAPVRSVTAHEGAFRVASGAGVWKTRCVVIATGHCDLPAIPGAARNLSPQIRQLTPADYCHPSDLPPGGVLVVGASASGAQIADALQRTGREVVLSIGRHTRVPRRYRGRDIMWWLDRTGILDERIESLPDLDAARAQPSFQIVGSSEGRAVDVRSLQSRGIRLVGRIRDVDGKAVRFADDLHETVEAADRKLVRLLERIDALAGAAALGGEAGSDDIDLSPVAPGPCRLDLGDEGIGAVVWATGYRRSYPWLHVPVLDASGDILHRGGLTAQPGLVVLGLRLLRRRSSSFIDGVGRDAEELTPHLLDHLRNTRRLAA